MKKQIKEKKDHNIKKKTRHLIGIKEFIFNIVSLVFALSVVLYFGGRCFYYYSLQSQEKKAASMTLNGMILDTNPLVKEGDGLHQIKDGYMFKGNVSNNYVWFANRMFRVLGINKDGSVKVVSNDLVSIFMWGESDSYDKSNIRLWLTNTNDEHSGIYYKTIPKQKNYIKKTAYTIDSLKKDSIKNGKDKYSDSVVSLSLNDYVNAGGKSSFLNNGKLFYLLGFSSDKENLYVEEDGSIRTCDKLDAYGIRAVVTIKKNLAVSGGDGTESNPYVILQNNDTNHVDGYVKLGNDTWKVFEENGDTLKMYLNGYIANGDVIRNYALYNNHFDYNEPGNIGNYLINDYLNSLSYRSVIVDNNYPIGEMSTETGYNYSNIYSNMLTGPVSMLNIFDYVSNNELSDFFRNNTTSSIGTIQYVTYTNGTLEETEISEEKHIVPVISIKSSSIKGGNGSKDNPYVVE